MFLIFIIPPISFLLLLISLVIAVIGFFKRNKKMKKIGMVGSFGAIFIFLIAVFLMTFNPEYVRESVIDLHERDMEILLQVTK